MYANTSGYLTEVFSIDYNFFVCLSLSSYMAENIPFIQVVAQTRNSCLSDKAILFPLAQKRRNSEQNSQSPIKYNKLFIALT